MLGQKSTIVAAIVLGCLQLGSSPAAQCPVVALEKFSPPQRSVDDRFPWALDLEKGRGLVGVLRPTAPSFGVAYVLARDGDTWIRTATLVPNPTIESGFGRALAIDGVHAAVSASVMKNDGFNHGSVVLFEQFGDAWIEVDVLRSPTTDPLDRFGLTMDMNGGRLAVGAHEDDEGGREVGAVYVYRHDGHVWSLEEKILAPVNSRAFGRAVDLDGDRMLVGTSGHAFVFVWSASDSRWVQEASLQAADAPGEIGGAVALSGDRAIVGASGHRHVGGAWGGAWIFVRRDGTWIEEIHLQPEYTAKFGHQVALVGSVAIVSEDAGPAYLYTLGPDGWKLAERPYGLDDPDGPFGSTLAFDGKDVLIGCYHCDFISCDTGSCQTAGALYPFSICAKAELESRNAGKNPLSLSGTPARIGENVELKVDLSTTGHALALPFASETRLERRLPNGQVLLAARRRQSLFRLPPLPGPTAVFDVPLPANASLIGFTFSVQALHIGGVTPFALSNALDFVIGEF